MTTDGGRPIVLLVELFVRPGREADFHRFETAVARVMRLHRGRNDRVIRPTGPRRADALPHEIQLVLFASAVDLEASRADPELRALAPLRESAIARTEVTMATDGEPYGDGRR
jgi:hypothetical protein